MIILVQPSGRTAGIHGGGGGGSVGGGGGGSVGGGGGGSVGSGGRGFGVGTGVAVGGTGVNVAVGRGRGVAVAVGVGVEVGSGVEVRVGISVGVRVGVLVGVRVQVGDGETVSPPPWGTMAAVAILPIDGVGVERPPPPLIPIITPANNANTATPPAAHAHTGTWRVFLAGLALPSSSSIFRVPPRPVEGTAAFSASSFRPRTGTGTPRAWAISAALCQRCERINSIAFSTAISVRSLTPGTMARGGTNCSGSAMRSVAVGGAWPVKAW